MYMVENNFASLDDVWRSVRQKAEFDLNCTFSFGTRCNLIHGSRKWWGRDELVQIAVYVKNCGREQITVHADSCYWSRTLL